MDVSPTGPSNPSYQQEVRRGAELFEKSFHEMQSSKIDAQKEQYKEVMRESLNVIHQAARGLMNDQIEELKNQLAQDLDAYLKDPSSSNSSKVESDISHLKRY
ncbi:MAG: hypothetical protein S4CHLAM102_08950 [Chlamydiia bacterium]|nr:hypothetical protein [Chlamydiia bacterium]